MKSSYSLKALKIVRKRPKLVFLWVLQERFFSNDGMAYAAQVAYFFSLSIFPLIIFIISLLSTLSINVVSIAEQINNLYGYQITSIFNTIMDDLVTDNSVAIVSISGIIVIYSASRAVFSLMKSLDVVYGVSHRRSYPKAKIWAILYTAIFALIIVILMIVPVISEKVIIFFEDILDFRYSDQLIDIINLLRIALLIGVTVVTFISVYVFVPNKDLSFRDGIAGAIFAILATFISMFGYNFLMNTFMDLSIIYGSLSTFVALMLWLYALGIIIIVGGEINVLIRDMKNRTLYKILCEEEEKEMLR